MKAAIRRISALSVLSLLALAAAHAQEPEKRWYTQADIQTLHSNYSDSVLRDALDNLGFFIRSDYLERGGFTLGYNRTALRFTDDTADVEQNGWFASARAQATPDWAKGQITFRLDGYVISNDGSTSEVTDVDVIAPQVSFLNYDRSFYMDLGYAKSSYGDSPLSAETLDVEQWTPTLGFGFNEQRGWVQLRAYLIEPSNASRAQDVEDTAALQLSYTHWTRARRFLGVDNFRFSALFGERVYAVDPDAAAVYNLTDLQSGGASIGSEWVPSERTRVLLLLGVERYEDRTLGDEYDSPFAYLNFTYRWY